MSNFSTISVFSHCKKNDMAQAKKEEFIKVTDKNGLSHIVPASSRNFYEKLNTQMKPTDRMKISVYDPANPEAPAEEVGYTPTITKLAQQNADLEAKNKELQDQLKKLQEAAGAAKSATKTAGGK